MTDSLKDTLLLTIIHHIRNGKGHVLSYHQAVSGAARQQGIDHHAIISSDPEISDTAFGCDNIHHASHNLLELEREPMMTLVKSPAFYKLVPDTFRLAADLAAAFRQIGTANKRIFVFYESFNPFQLAALFIAYFQLGRPAGWTFLLLMRGSDKWGLEEHSLMSRGFHFGFWVLLKLNSYITRAGVRLLSDSETVARRLREYYREPVTVFPIPHTASTGDAGPKSSRDEEKVKLWWPGHPRPDKGASLINALISHDDPRLARFELAHARTDLLDARQAAIGTRELNPMLSRNAYIEQFEEADAILLPYSKSVYNEATSGVFVETIFHARVPFVTSETWMADELRRFNLEWAIFDGTVQDLIERLASVDFSDLPAEFGDMVKHYRIYHSVSSFGRHLETAMTQDV